MTRQYSNVVITDDNVDAEGELMIDRLPIEIEGYGYVFMTNLPEGFDKVTNEGNFDYYHKYYDKSVVIKEPDDIESWYSHEVAVEVGNGFIAISFEYDDGEELRDKG